VCIVKKRDHSKFNGREMNGQIGNTFSEILFEFYALTRHSRFSRTSVNKAHVDHRERDQDRNSETTRRDATPRRAFRKFRIYTNLRNIFRIRDRSRAYSRPLLRNIVLTAFDIVFLLHGIFAVYFSIGLYSHASFYTFRVSAVYRKFMARH